LATNANVHVHAYTRARARTGDTRACQSYAERTLEYVPYHGNNNNDDDDDDDTQQQPQQQQQQQNARLLQARVFVATRTLHGRGCYCPLRLLCLLLFLLLFLLLQVWEPLVVPASDARAWCVFVVVVARGQQRR
jgi:hypothetical protein